ncbi:MAG TPA: GNAT family N-acetyltransferase [Actinomycetota bacterium]|nr:GNAT family N-acetyltransferase [Actinomycetota bacterium]
MARPPQRNAPSRRGQALVAETPRLLIRLPEERDAGPYHAIHADPDVTRWLGGVRPNSVEDELERIALRRAMQDDLGYTMWTVEEKESGKVVGLSGLFPVEKTGPDIELAYHYRKDRWGRGYATEAARACLDYGFGAGLDRIVGLVAPHNRASAHVLEKCGMRLVGPVRYYDTDLVEYELHAKDRSV